MRLVDVYNLVTSTCYHFDKTIFKTIIKLPFPYQHIKNYKEFLNISQNYKNCIHYDTKQQYTHSYPTTKIKHESHIINQTYTKNPPIIQPKTTQLPPPSITPHTNRSNPHMPLSNCKKYTIA